MDTNNLKDISEILKNLMTTLAIVVGGIWAFRKYILQRENVAKIHSSLSIAFISKNNNFWVTEIAALIENKGLVKHKIFSSTFLFELRYISKDSNLINQKIDSNHETHQVLFDKPIYLNEKQIIENKWLPENWEFITIEPGIKRRISLIVSIPIEAKTIFLRSKFKLHDAKRPHDSIKTFIEVPQ